MTSQVPLYREALLQLRERGTESDPCWCARETYPHDPYCEQARRLICPMPAAAEVAINGSEAPIPREVSNGTD